jgi:dihydrofolate reductase
MKLVLMARYSLNSNRERVLADSKGNMPGQDIEHVRKADFERFRRETMGYPIVMGRKTFEEIGRPLPGRINIVISRSLEGSKEVIVKRDFESGILEASRYAEKVFIQGGEEIYRQAIVHPATWMIDLTEVRLSESFEGPIKFPYFDENNWTADRIDNADYSFIKFIKKL